MIIPQMIMDMQHYIVPHKKNLPEFHCDILCIFKVSWYKDNLCSMNFSNVVHVLSTLTATGSSDGCRKEDLFCKWNNVHGMWPYLVLSFHLKGSPLCSFSHRGQAPLCLLINPIDFFCFPVVCIVLLTSDCVLRY